MGEEEMPEPIEITNMKKNAEDREYVLKTVKEKPIF